MKLYRTIQQWDHWLTQFLGASVLEAEQRVLSRFLADFYGKNALLLGVPRQSVLFDSSAISQRVAVSPLTDRRNRIRCIESQFYDLPIASSSIDLVLLPHTLDFTDNAEKLISEACRVVKPEGRIVILGFNPFSFWGLTRSFIKSNRVPWSFNFIKTSTIKKWLTFAHFELVKEDKLIFRPPLKNHAIYEKIKFLEWFGRQFFKPLGGVYVIAAKAKVIPLTPIKLKWKQKIPAVSMTVPRPTMRDGL